MVIPYVCLFPSADQPTTHVGDAHFQYLGITDDIWNKAKDRVKIIIIYTKFVKRHFTLRGQLSMARERSDRIAVYSYFLEVGPIGKVHFSSRSFNESGKVCFLPKEDL